MESKEINRLPKGKNCCRRFLPKLYICTSKFTQHSQGRVQRLSVRTLRMCITPHFMSTGKIRLLIFFNGKVCVCTQHTVATLTPGGTKLLHAKFARVNFHYFQEWSKNKCEQKTPRKSALKQVDRSAGALENKSIYTQHAQNHPNTIHNHFNPH
jgi:hypothetical protein